MPVVVSWPAKSKWSTTDAGPRGSACPRTCSGPSAGRTAARRLAAGGGRRRRRGPRLDRRHVPRMPAVLNGGRGSYFRVSRFSTFFRTLPIFFTAFLTAGADLPVFFASLRDRRSLFLRPQHPRAGRLASGRHHVVLAGRDRSAGDRAARGNSGRRRLDRHRPRERRGGVRERRPEMTALSPTDRDMLVAA